VKTQPPFTEGFLLGLFYSKWLERKPLPNRTVIHFPASKKRWALLLQKNFGGSVYYKKKTSGHYRVCYQLRKEALERLEGVARKKLTKLLPP